MIFSSYSFLILFLPLALLSVAVVRRIGGLRAALGALLVTSLLYYVSASTDHPWQELLLVICGSIGFNHLIGRIVMPGQFLHPVRKSLLIVGIAINLLVLCWYKYAGFLGENLLLLAEYSGMTPSGELIARVDGLGQMTLLTGISFFTFQQIAYLVDAFRGQTKGHGFLEYALFVMYFPQMVAGPIVHHTEVLPQWSHPDALRLKSRELFVGLTMFTIGLAKKVLLADTLSPCVGTTFGMIESSPNELAFCEAWIGAIAYTLQLYFDFSGYSDMAIGLARMIGIKLPANFDSPYQATSIIDFWRRWHITLSRFLRDYLYIPLGGNQKGSVRRYVNLMLTMILGGLWHGAGWNFLFWGFLHGFYLCINHGWSRIRGVSPGARPKTWFGKISARGLTFVAVVVGWVFFRAQSFPASLGMLSSMAGVNGLYRVARLDSGLPLTHVQRLFGSFEVGQIALITTLLAVVWLLPNSQQQLRRHRPVLGPRPIAPAVDVFGWLTWRPIPLHALTLAVMMVASVMMLSRGTEFIYYNF
ncbi:MAG: MBOAT family protein [Planctomycetaceae bacterium]|nr:MBOAT family protein [Planctomycetaceae bacterium]